MSETISQARAFLATSQPDKALEILSPHIESNSTSPEFLSILGETLLENNQLEEAYQVLTTACQLDPEAQQGTEKFLYLGQIIGGQDGLNYINTGLNKLNDQLAEIGNENVVMEAEAGKDKSLQWIINKLNQGIFASIEIWMTDLCMEEEAESKCNELIQYSLSVDATNPETYSQLSSIRISQQKNDEAIEALNRAWDLFQDKKTQLEDFANSKKSQQDAADDVFEVGMEYVELIQPLITLSKLAIELERYDTAIDIVSHVQDINDSILDAYYIEAIANLFKAKEIYASLHPQLEGDYRDVEIAQLQKSSNNDSNEEIAALIADARSNLTSGFKIINSELVDECDLSVVDQVNELLSSLGGPLMSELLPKREKDDDVDWENEIDYEE
ncbi:uncharacterized protein LODBEIA_P15150 [Lodderomyces beijingensis]|uniref:Assembly chaperone of RPL4 n=1 Tax=Lodderomyces beijingensis TaxID=1775926 RepID=A0ABP0ZK88_9ASCO